MARIFDAWEILIFRGRIFRHFHDLVPERFKKKKKKKRRRGPYWKNMLRFRCYIEGRNSNIFRAQTLSVHPFVNETITRK